jgi:NAD(P)-dependent dehydrogenase (short-subunit alcohol dehydrogenase family)
MTNMNGKVVLITGAKGGLGTYVTQCFLDSGATVVGVSRSIQNGDFSHANFTAMPAELSSAERAGEVVDCVVSRFGRLDAVLHLLGGFAGGKPLSETDDETLDRMLDLNLRSAFRIVRAALPALRAAGGGCIVAIGTRAAVEPAPLAAAYAASKAALVALIRAVAAESKDDRIRANVLLPGTMDTPANRKADPAADFSKWVDPACVASLALHLVSDSGSPITGAAIPVYGRDF